MNIKVKKIETGTKIIPVDRVLNLEKLSVEEIIKKLNLFNVMINYHYNVCEEYKNVDDLYSGETLDYLSEVLYDAYQNDDFDYNELSKKIMDSLEDKLIEEIYCRDENAEEDYNARKAGLKGDY